MAPNPNECVVLQLQQPATSGLAQVIKIVTTSDDSSEESEHFYDASSDIGAELATGKTSPDSGIEDAFDIPDDQLAGQIVEQVEFYFSDGHILKDAFLLKHARRNRDGFISLKLITSFKKVKHVTKDWRVVAFACRKLSKQLEVNEAGTKVRRVAPLPDTDETSPSRTVVAIGLAADKASIEAVAEMFNNSGSSIGLIRILRPGSAIPPDVRQCANRHADILTSICAVIEFEQADGARNALKDAAAMMPAGVRLVELASRRGNSNRASPTTSRPVTPVSEANTPNNRRKRRTNNNKVESDAETTPRSPFLRRHQQDSSNASTPNQSPQQRRHVPAHVQTANRPKSASYSECSSSSNLGSSPPGSHSPWVLRRLGLMAQDSGRCSPLSVPTNVLRMPNGPDGTRGFHLNGKPRSASAPEVPLMITV